MEPSRGFRPIANADARVLVLGSLPGQKSLLEQQYYAHPQNAFWPIMRELFGISGKYDSRCEQLLRHQIALWDVLQASVRPGSLDANIRPDTTVANNFRDFFHSHADIELIAFNGKKAEQLFRRSVAASDTGSIAMIGLPSTSPAFAAMPFAGKLDAWKVGFSSIKRKKEG